MLRTTDGGRHWRPQRIASGAFPGTEGVIAPSATRAYALTSTPAAGSGIVRSLFTTGSGGDAGTPSTLSLTTDTRRVSRRVRRITVRGALNGAQGGEPIVVSARNAQFDALERAGRDRRRQRRPLHRDFSVRGPAEFVARWAGDSGRQGAGSSVLKVTVRR